MPLSLINSFADSSSGIGALGINGTAILIQLITFLIVFWVLKRYAFKPIIRILKQRRELIESGVSLGEEMQKEKTKLEASIGEQLHKARDEADGIVGEAEKQARLLLQETEKSAKEKAENIVAQADVQIQQDTLRAKKQLEKELVNLIAETTEAIIREKVDAKKDASLIDRLLHEKETGMKTPRLKIASVVAEQTLEKGLSKKLSRELAAYLLSEGRTTEVDSLLRDIQEYWAVKGIVNVTVISAHKVSAKIVSDVKNVAKQIYPKAKKFIVTEQLDPNLIGAAQIEFANRQLDLSIRTTLDHFKQLVGAGKD